MNTVDPTPQDFDALSALAEFLYSTRRHDHAAVVLARVIGLCPRDAAAHRRLAGTLAELGRNLEAADAWRQAINLDPTNARAYNNLGRVLLTLGQPREAMSNYRDALRLDPAYAIAHNNLGWAYHATGEWLAASDSFERALRNTPGLVDAWVGRGAACAKLGRLDSALHCFEAALILRPDDVATLAYQAWMFLALERPGDSLAAADAACLLDANSAPAHHARAGALRRLGRRAEALRCLGRVLELNPTCVEAWCDLATLSHEIGRFEDSQIACRRALDLDPNSLQTRTRLLSRLIPNVPVSMQQVVRARAAFDRHLIELRCVLESSKLSETDSLAVAQQQFFYLSYEEVSNRHALENYRGASARRLASFLGLGAPLSIPSRDRRQQRLRLGFASAHVHDHSVFNAILRGWLQNLNPQRFEISLFQIGNQVDSMTQSASATAARFESGIRTAVEWRQTIHDHELDTLIYPEIGMNETTLALASLRLAPRQFVAWGHPETSGLSTIDCYLSAELFEPPDAQAHYTEKLLRLPNFGVYCERYGVTSSPIDLERMGIDSRYPVFICPGVPFKYRPQDDVVLVEIAKRLGRCTFVFFEYEIVELSALLQQRITGTFESQGLDAGYYVRLIPWQPREAFFALLRQADVYLDTIGFSGFNTMMQAIECGLPCVTYEGRFLRGRLGSGILTRLDMSHCIARDTEHYVQLAVRLGENPDYRSQIRNQLRSAEPRLYGDLSAVDALSRFLLADP